MEWMDAVLVEDLTKERATADKETKFMGANMKTTRLGKPKGASFLQMGPPVYYYPVHPAFLQQAQRVQAHATQERSEEGTAAQAKGWGDYGTPLYDASQFGNYDGLGGDGLGGMNMYGNYGYAPYVSGYNPAYTAAAGGQYNGGVGYFNPFSTPYASPYGTYAPYSPPTPPSMPTDLPLPPWIQQV